MMQAAGKRLRPLHHSFMQHCRCASRALLRVNPPLSAVFVLAVAAHCMQSYSSQAVQRQLQQSMASGPLMYSLSVSQARNRRLAADVQSLQRQLEANGAAMTQMQGSIAEHAKVLEEKDALIQHLEDDIFRSAAKGCSSQSAQCVLQ